MLKRNKRLIIATIATLLFFVGYTLFIDNTYFDPGESDYPLITEQEATEIVAETIEHEQGFVTDPGNLTAELYINAEAERFLDDQGLTETYLATEHVPPISMWKVSFYDLDMEMETVYFVDLMKGDIVGFLDSTYYNEDFQDEETLDEQIASKWLQEQGWDNDFTLATQDTNDDGVLIHEFVSKKPVIGDVFLLLKVYTLDGWFTGFYPKLDVPKTYTSSPLISGLSSSLGLGMSLAYFGLIFIVGLIYWAMRATDKSLTVTVPLLAGCGLLIIGTLMMTNIFGFLDSLLSSFLLFMALLTVYSKRNRLGNRSPERMGYWREKVFQGYMLGIISFLPSFVFYTISEYVFNTWGSSQDSFVLLKDAKWIMLTPFLVGLYAAVSEEIMYRKFGELVFKRVWNNQIFIALITSLIWSVGHIGYTVHPWYLRVIELTFFVGPFMYWIYKKYGLSVSITAHYLFNCFLVSLTLISFDAERYVYSLLFLLVPLVIFIIPAKRRTPSEMQRVSATDQPM